MGHACFLLRGEAKRLMFDPFKGTGLPEPTEKADIILCSHSHSDHNNVKAVRHEKSLVLEGFTGVKQIDNVSVRGIAAYHDTAHGGQRGKNSVYTVRFDDTMFCHLGDLTRVITIAGRRDRSGGCAFHTRWRFLHNWTSRSSKRDEVHQTEDHGSDALQASKNVSHIQRAQHSGRLHTNR